MFLSLFDPRLPICIDKRYLGVLALLTTVFLVLVYSWLVLLGFFFSGCCGCSCFGDSRIIAWVLWPLKHNPLVTRAKVEQI